MPQELVKKNIRRFVKVIGDKDKHLDLENRVLSALAVDLVNQSVHAVSPVQTAFSFAKSA